MPADITDPIADKILAGLMPFAPTDDTGTQARLSDRQILIVDSYTLHSASFVQSSSDPTPRSGYHVRCTGRPSPSSTVVQGIIHFAHKSALKTPVFNAKAQQLQLFLDIEGMAQTLTQLTHPDRYLWIGFFAGGHIYGDLHSSL